MTRRHYIRNSVNESPVKSEHGERHILQNIRRYSLRIVETGLIFSVLSVVAHQAGQGLEIAFFFKIDRFSSRFEDVSFNLAKIVPFMACNLKAHTYLLKACSWDCSRRRLVLGGGELKLVAHFKHFIAHT